MELDILTKDGTRPKKRQVAEASTEPPPYERPPPRLHAHAWYTRTARVYASWTGKSLTRAYSDLDPVTMPVYRMVESAAHTPEVQALRAAFGKRGRSAPLKPGKRPGSQPGQLASRARTSPLVEQRLPFALICSCLTAFILPLYDGNAIFYVRWIMTIISAAIGPQLTGGIYPSMGVLIIGLMINRPLATCTLALGAWASFFLALVMIKAVGLKPPEIDE